MADVKIASLTASTTPTDTDIMIIEDNSDTKKITYANLKSGMHTDPTFTGTVTASQIKFPAVQVPSADPNTLDDYKEAVIVPIISAQSGTFGNVNGSISYTKIGQLYSLELQINIIDAGTASGVIELTLPFIMNGTNVGVGKENASTGSLLTLLSFSNVVQVTRYDGGTIIGTGYSILGTIICR